jgi:CBS domain-containing protein
MNVKEVMVAAVKSCGPNDVVNWAAQIMWENDCGCLPVVDGASRVIGMLTDRDICMAAYTQGAGLSAILVSSAMSRDVFSCRPSDDLLAAQRVMREHQVRRLPVTDAAKKLVGIVSLNDIARAAALTAAGKAQVASTLVAVCTPHQGDGEPRAREPQEQHRGRSSHGGRHGGTRHSEPSTEGTPRR